MKDQYWLRLKGNLPRLLGFDQRDIRDRLTLFSVKNDQTLCILSNLCENSLFGNTLAPLTDSFSYSKIPLYIPVVRESVYFGSIDLRTVNDYVFPLSPVTSVVLTLHFKRIY